MSQKHVVVIIGASGIGLAAARRIAGDRTIVLGARSQTTRDTAKEALQAEGHTVKTIEVHVSDHASVKAFAHQAASIGTIDVVVHTAGVSPMTAESTEEIIQVDLLGAAYVIDAFQEFAVQGTSVICISSMSAHMTFALPPVSVAELINHEEYKQVLPTAGHQAYAFAKYANNLRVQGAAMAYGEKGARINSISPGVIMTKMGHQELEGEMASGIEAVIGASPLKRAATPADVANTIAFLAGQESSYITGSDLKVDGGSVASTRWLLYSDGLPREQTSAA
ncbi:Putative short-chain dehydrogenase/reductase SDR, NAD(P)-binding domain superfamily [Septoria linicola]|uniref:Short-chain dehydrogenase/reductase SDR, NAD(P)-binding domain superfamily n=1 Tax=Septoria linicola TaxID=215465 RepID=A0A9Q9ARU1_9PEZI|nr:Putative short-chain dehydrogenase/reductase SDR, NAD(P)-binding domain superfamily [Septoria linicola]